jgi:hypothetical protein
MILGPAGAAIVGDGNPAKSWGYNNADGSFYCNWNVPVPSANDPSITYDTL